MDYHHEPLLAPTAEILTAYRKKTMTWSAYEQAYIDLICDRQVENALSPTLLDNAVLLCSEDSPMHCHRRLAAEYFAARWSKVEIIHL